MNDHSGRASATNQRSAQTRTQAEPLGADLERPSILSMIGFVAASVAVTILVFFGIGYLFGRLFL